MSSAGIKKRNPLGRNKLEKKEGFGKEWKNLIFLIQLVTGNLKYLLHYNYEHGCSFISMIEMDRPNNLVKCKLQSCSDEEKKKKTFNAFLHNGPWYVLPYCH